MEVAAAKDRTPNRRELHDTDHPHRELRCKVRRRICLRYFTEADDLTVPPVCIRSSEDFIDTANSNEDESGHEDVARSVGPDTGFQYDHWQKTIRAAAKVVLPPR